jgi:DNA-binding LytR/AlgR family response regulator
MTAMKTLIVEDEPRAQRVLENLLRTHFPEMEITGHTASVKETVAWLADHKPDVIFMDVELSDGSCFDIFAQTPVNAQVVMTTAYDNYAVKAFEVNSVDYLLKPIEVEDLRRAVNRVSERLTSGGGIDFEKVLEAFRLAQKGEDFPLGEGQKAVGVPGVLPAGRPREKFLIRLNDRIVPVSVHEVAYFYSEAKNSFIVTRSGKTYVLDDSLDAIEAGLDPKAFFRISRGAIIAENVIDSASKLLGGRLRLSLKPGIPSGADLTVSRARADAFLDWLEG